MSNKGLLNESLSGYVITRYVQVITKLHYFHQLQLKLQKNALISCRVVQI